MTSDRGRAQRVGTTCLFALLSIVSSARAQDRPTVFLHGFNSDGSGWVSTAERLSSITAITPMTPNMTWRNRFEDQARDLNQHSTYGSLPASTIAVGHSNGGLLARTWSRTRPLGGVVTIGTPHRGAPILPHLLDWTTFTSFTAGLVTHVVQAYSHPTDWSWTIAEVANMLGWASEFSIWSSLYLAGTLGVDKFVPVTGDMDPRSSFVAGLNTPDNINREIYSLDGRVGIVSTTSPYAGPARAIFPANADTIAAVLYASAYGLLGWGNYVLSRADPMDYRAVNQGLSLVSLSSQLLAIDPMYCAMVSTLDLSRCDKNDGLVPYWSQEFPFAPNLYLGWSDANGPAHTQERDAGRDALYDALVYFMHVSPRTSGPAPAPAPAPDPGGSNPGGGGDDEEEDDDESGGVESELRPNTALYPGEYVSSSNRRYQLVYQGDGNLVLYEDGGTPIWASQTHGRSAGVLVMQGDGNLVLYDGNDEPIWHTSTHGFPGAYLHVGDDGNAVVYDANGSALWATHTAR